VPLAIRKGKDNKMVADAHGPDGSFPLVGGHAPGKVSCTDCHTGRSTKGKTSFESVEPNCNANGRCHEDSLHQGTLGQGCNNDNCHKTPGYWPVKFDHDKPFPKDAKGEVSAWPLKGEHKINKCADCHPKRDFAAAHSTCSAEGCHAEDDAHKGRLGAQCERCHVETGDNVFNHNKQSAFHLDGKHLEVRCNDCHPSITFKPRPTNCFGCHPEPKIHKGQYGTACEQCHSTRTFSDIKPAHDVGDFSLKGMHDNIACERCHKDNRPLAGSGNLCINCHRQDDIHQNSLSPRCGECHTQWSFAPARFDHTTVGCSLTGLHRTLSCNECHRGGNYRALSPNCVGCHRDEAARKGPPHTTYVTCAGCHNPNYWEPQNQTIMTGGYSFFRESVCR
jgi:hypothetical protein